MDDYLIVCFLNPSLTLFFKLNNNFMHYTKRNSDKVNAVQLKLTTQLLRLWEVVDKKNEKINNKI